MAAAIAIHGFGKFSSMESYFNRVQYSATATCAATERPLDGDYLIFFHKWCCTLKLSNIESTFVYLVISACFGVRLAGLFVAAISNRNYCISFRLSFHGHICTDGAVASEKEKERMAPSNNLAHCF